MDPQSWFSDLTGYFLYLLFVSTLGPLLFGFHLSELNTPEDVMRCNKKSIGTTTTGLPQCIPMNATQWGLVGSIFTLGGLLGALAIGPVAGQHGRLKAMHYTTIFFTVGPIFETLAPNIGVLSFGRFISGIGAGASVVVVPIYISEIAPPEKKGFFGAFTQIMTNIGILLTQLLGYFLSKGQYWRIILAFAGAIGASQAIALFFAVESPSWTADQGSLGKAKKALQRIRGNTLDIEEETSNWGAHHSSEIDDERETLLPGEDQATTISGSNQRRKMKRKEIVGFFQVIRHPDYNKAVFAVIMVMVAQQLTGINSIIMYGVHLLSGLLKSNSALLNLGVSAMNIIVTAGCAPLVDKLGRKLCLLTSIAGMGTSAIILAIGILNSISLLSAVAVILFVSSFALGLGPIPFILASELVGPEAVGATQSWALGSNWISTFLVAQFFPIAEEKLHGKVYFIFACLAVIFWIFVASFVPETKGKKNADEVWGRESRLRED